MLKIRVFASVVDVRGNMHDAQALKADRLASDQAFLGLLDNTTPNTALLLELIGETLSEDAMVPVVPEQDDFRLVSHGAVGPHSIYIPGSLGSKPVTMPVVG